LAFVAAHPSSKERSMDGAQFHLTQFHLQQFHLTQFHLQQFHLQQFHLQQFHLTQFHLQQFHLTQFHLPQFHLAWVGNSGAGLIQDTFVEVRAISPKRSMPIYPKARRAATSFWVEHPAPGHPRLRQEIRVGWCGLLASAGVSATIARFIAFELRGVPALGGGFLANFRRRAVIAVLGVV